MRRSGLIILVAIALCTSVGLALQAPAGGPYKVLKTARVGGEGGTDYIYADVAGRRLYIPRGGARAAAATDTTPAVAAVAEADHHLRSRHARTGRRDPRHRRQRRRGRSEVGPRLLEQQAGLDVRHEDDEADQEDRRAGAAQPDGIYFDAFNDRVYVFSHPTKDATVIDAKDGTVLGTIDLGGVPEQARRRRQGHALRRHAGRAGQRRGRRRRRR